MLRSDEYKAVFEASPDGCLVVDRSGVVRDANAQIEAMFGWPRSELLSREIEVLVPEALRTRHVRHRESFMSSPRSRPMGIGLELEGRRRDGTRFPIEISLSPWNGDEPLVICTVRDITDRRRLRNFSESSLRASEHERRRIARELHDDTAQRLATLILRVRTLAHTEASEARVDLYEEIRDEIVEASEGVKRIARGLRPPELEEVGLRAAVHAHARTLREGASFSVDAVLDDVDAVLSETPRLVFYRVIQEALSNALRHSGSTGARVRLGVEGDHVFAEVSDDGQGFVAERVSQEGAGLGLVGMQERASMIGAELTIRSGPGRGTAVRLALPLSARVAEHV